jgi:hypothetical protein
MNFGDMHARVKLYKFAHRMQIEALIDELDEQFKQVKPDEVFQIFDLYHVLCKNKLFNLRKVRQSLFYC